MNITMLGTGHAMVTEIYNTCFVINDDGKYFMVDGGGGNTIIRQLKLANIKINDIHHIFVTHKHVDHIMGIVWMVRMITSAMLKGKYNGEAFIYGHDEVIRLINAMSSQLLQAKEIKFIGDRLHLVEVIDGESRTINDRNVTFFDIHSTKAKQFGFCMELDNGEKLTCCGDEPYNEAEEKYAKDSKWLLHEAFCLFSEADKFKPYEKHHSTAKDAGELACKLNVKNLLLYHTEDENILKRKELYKNEVVPHFHGNIYVPDDLEVIEL